MGIDPVNGGNYGHAPHTPQRPNAQQCRDYDSAMNDVHSALDKLKSDSEHGASSQQIQQDFQDLDHKIQYAQGLCQKNVQQFPSMNNMMNQLNQLLGDCSAAQNGQLSNDKIDSDFNRIKDNFHHWKDTGDFPA